MRDGGGSVEVPSQGRHANAEAQWRAALAEQPDFAPAWAGLGDLALAHQR